MTMTYDTPTAYLTAAQYADSIGKAERTVKRWLADAELPGAHQDDRGRWMIPADAERTPTTDGVVSLVPDRHTTRPMTVEISHGHGPLIDTLPSFLDLDEASAILGISRHAIATHRDYFGVVPFGPNGSLVIPLATIKRIRG